MRGDLVAITSRHFVRLRTTGGSMHMGRAGLGVAAATSAAALAVTALGTAAPAAVPHTLAVPAVAGHTLVHGVSSPLSSEQCQAKWHINCYNPLQYRTAYDLNALYKK